MLRRRFGLTRYKEETVLEKAFKQIKSAFEDAYYRLACAVVYKYNHVKVKTLPPTWQDRDKLLLHVNMQVLVDFIEGEDPFGLIDWTTSREQHRVRNKLAKIYYWWKYDRPNREDPLVDVEVPDSLFPDEEEESPRAVAWRKACRRLYELECQWDKEDQSMLKRLVNLRPWLWT